MKPDSRRAIFAALGANFGIAVAKFIGFTVTRSASLLAESVHSVADTGNQALLLWGASAADRQPTPVHPFGFGRERYFWSFIVAMILFSLGSLFAMYHGFEKFIHAVPLEEAQWAVGILIVSVIFESASFYTAISAAIPVKGNNSWRAFVWGTKSPELPVVLLEDLGALLGLLIALIGVGMSLITGDARYDAAASILIGVLLGLIAGVLAVKMKSLLIGESANPKIESEIREALDQTPEIERVIHMRTQHLGPEEILLGAKIEFASTLTVGELSGAINKAESRVRAALPSLDLKIYLEPDIFDASRNSEV